MTFFSCKSIFYDTYIAEDMFTTYQNHCLNAVISPLKSTNCFIESSDEVINAVLNKHTLATQKLSTTNILSA